MLVWTLVDFLPRLDAWIQQEDPSPDLRLHVTDWIFTRATDPYQGVRREVGFDNLWFGPVPESGHENGLAVMCAYWIFETTRTVRCDSFASLGQPL